MRFRLARDGPRRVRHLEVLRFGRNRWLRICRRDRSNLFSMNCWANRQIQRCVRVGCGPGINESRAVIETVNHRVVIVRLLTGATRFHARRERRS